METEQDSRGREIPIWQLSLRRKQSGSASLATAVGEAPDVKGSFKRVSEQVMKEMYADPHWGPLLRKADATRAARMKAVETSTTKARDMLGETFEK